MSKKDNKKIKKGKTFNIGDKVEVSGSYVCAPCGYYRKYKKGEKFQRCFKCLKGKRTEGKIFIKGLGLWEYLE